jgi:hypothetical protein
VVCDESDVQPLIQFEIYINLHGRPDNGLSAYRAEGLERMFTRATRGIDLRYAVRVAMLAIGYLVAARLSLVLAIPPGHATDVSPPSEIAFARGGARHAARRIASSLRHGDCGPSSGVAGYCQARLSTVFSYVAPGATSPHPSVH